MKTLLHFLIRTALALLPYRLVKILFALIRERLDDDFLFARGIPTMFGSLRKAAAQGLKPATVVDIGAFVGNWTRAAKPIFPAAKFLLVEANPEKRTALEAVRQQLDGVDFVNVLLGSQAQEAVPYHLLETGSSVLEEVTGYSKNLVHLPMQTLDQVMAGRNLPGPYFLKLDVQGYELEVLRGAERTLQQTSAILAEVALLEYNKNAPLAAEVIAFLHERGFEPFDILSFARRSSDSALFQVDILFVQRDHTLRARRKFHEDEPEA